ncbi:hypothetical protein DL96DRAFT_1580903 [Flagelloscypha sp. PMI_526]|nr:hypothetical protein DL96DRAFT_1580903 [Flagelloscypha sp. PMI_526]
MTPEEAVFLQIYGQCVIGNFFLMTVESVLCTTGLLLYIASTTVLFRRAVKGQGTVFLLVLTTLSTFVMLFDWATFVVENFAVFRIGLVGLPGSTIETQFLGVLKHNDWILKFSEWPLQIHLLVCDTVVVSRVWAMFPERTRERWCVAISLLADIGVNFGYTSWRMILPLGIPSVKPYLIVTDWHITGMMMSLFTNIMATGFIAWKAWRHRQSLKKTGFNPKSKHSPVQRILALFLESGIAFMILQILVIITRFIPVVVRSTPDMIQRCVLKAFINLAAMYPMIVIIIVERKRGLLDETQYFGEGTLDLEVGDEDVKKKNTSELSEIQFGSETTLPERTYQSRKSAFRTQEFVVSFASAITERA